MFSIKNLLKLNPIRSTIIITSCLISSLLTVFVRYNLTWQADLLKENNIQGFLYLSLISLIAYILSSILSNFGNYFLLTKSVQEYLHSIRGAMLKRYSNNIDSSKVQNDLINNLETVNLQIGDKLKIPKKESKKTYIVQKGDSLWSIAKDNNTSVEELKLLNNLTSNLLSIGQELILP